MATDGELRLCSYRSCFYGHLGDIGVGVVASGVPEHPGQRGAQPSVVIGSGLCWSGSINVDDVEFIRANAAPVPKITIPSPCAPHFRGGDQAVLANAWDDAVKAFDRELRALADASCRYAQIDETAFAKFGDPDVRATLNACGTIGNGVIDKFVSDINRVLANVPPTMSVGMHLCRGNRGGQWYAECDYDSVVERLFDVLNISLYLLGYDSPWAGTCTPLRFVPSHKWVVLGLVSTKTPELESMDALKKRIDEVTATSISTASQ